MSWWDKVGGDRPNEAPRRAPFDPSIMPRGMGQDHGRAIDHYMGREQPQDPYEDQRYQQQRQQMPTDGSLPPLPGPPTIFDRRAMVQSDIRKTEAPDVGVCPSCGSPRWMVPLNQTVQGEKGQGRPRAYCSDCGHTENRVDQGSLIFDGTQGAIVGSTMGAKLIGRPHDTRQGDMLPSNFAEFESQHTRQQ
jgi:hypothetical protein